MWDDRSFDTQQYLHTTIALYNVEPDSEQSEIPNHLYTLGTVCERLDKASTS
jgi:hypothetical protein